jgi:hypothetical protein
MATHSTAYFDFMEKHFCLLRIHRFLETPSNCLHEPKNHQGISTSWSRNCNDRMTSLNFVINSDKVPACSDRRFEECMYSSHQCLGHVLFLSPWNPQNIKLWICLLTITQTILLHLPYTWSKTPGFIPCYPISKFILLIFRTEKICLFLRVGQESVRMTM